MSHFWVRLTTARRQFAVRSMTDATAAALEKDANLTLRIRGPFVPHFLHTQRPTVVVAVVVVGYDDRVDNGSDLEDVVRDNYSSNVVVVFVVWGICCGGADFGVVRSALFLWSHFS